MEAGSNRRLDPLPVARKEWLFNYLMVLLIDQKLKYAILHPCFERLGVCAEVELHLTIPEESLCELQLVDLYFWVVGFDRDLLLFVLGWLGCLDALTG